MHYLLFYEVGEDYVSRRAEFRNAHLQKAWAATERGELVLGGALANPVDGAVLLFKGDSPEVAEKFAKADPYVTSGTVKRWYVREWNTVAGEDAAIPVKPDAALASNRTLSASFSAGTESSSPDRPSEECLCVDRSSVGRASEDRSSEDQGPILRLWRARSTAEKAGEYVQHATKRVFPSLLAIPGHRGAFLLRRAAAGAIELVVLTLWESMDAVRKFAGAQPDKALVEPEARSILISFDESVTHFQVVDGMQITAK